MSFIWGRKFDKMSLFGWLTVEAIFVGLKRIPLFFDRGVNEN